jgi:hypothetical protein
VPSRTVETPERVQANRLRTSWAIWRSSQSADHVDLDRRRGLSDRAVALPRGSAFLVESYALPEQLQSQEARASRALWLRS